MRKRIIALVGVLAMFATAGCGTEEKKKVEVTKPPAEALTEIPEPTVEVTPTEGAEMTPSGQEDEGYPYEVQFTVKDEVTEEKDGDFVYFKSAIHYPVFEGKNADNMNRFVTSVLESFRENLPEAKENAKYDYEEFKKGEYGAMLFPEEEEFFVSCVWGKEQYLSIFTKGLSDTGGAHPNVYCKAYVVDVTSGDKKSFESMIQPYELTTEEIVTYVVARLRTEYEDELYVVDEENFYENKVLMFIREHQWYFNDRGLVLFANPYDIAAYAYGMIECEISYEELEEGLKK